MPSLPSPSVNFMSGFMQGYNFVEQIERNRKFDERQAKLLEMQEERLGFERNQEERAQETFDLQKEDKTRQGQLRKAQALLHEYKTFDGVLPPERVKDVIENPDTYAVDPATLSVFENHQEVMEGVREFDEAFAQIKEVGALGNEQKQLLISGLNKAFRDEINKGQGAHVVKQISDAYYKGGQLFFEVNTLDTNTGEQSTGPVTLGRTANGEDTVRGYTPEEVVGIVANRAKLAGMIESQIIGLGGTIKEKDNLHWVNTGDTMVGVNPKTGDKVKEYKISLSPAEKAAAKAKADKEGAYDKVIKDIPDWAKFEILDPVMMPDGEGGMIQQTDADGKPMFGGMKSEFEDFWLAADTPQITSKTLTQFKKYDKGLNVMKSGVVSGVQKAGSMDELLSIYKQVDKLDDMSHKHFISRLSKTNPQEFQALMAAERVIEGGDPVREWQMLHPKPAGGKTEKPMVGVGYLGKKQNPYMEIIKDVGTFAADVFGSMFAPEGDSYSIPVSGGEDY